MLIVEAGQLTHPTCDPDDKKVHDDCGTPAVLRILSSEALDEYLSDAPGRCSSCGFDPPTQGHAADCNRRRSWDEKTYPVLFAGSDICRDCGEPYSQDGFSTRCQRRHWVWQDRPCERCAGAIDYTSPRKLDDGTVNPKSLTAISIVTPAEGKRRGWGKGLINALSNKQPVHAACAKARS
jgi:hypothetical protein